MGCCISYPKLADIESAPPLSKGYHGAKVVNVVDGDTVTVVIDIPVHDVKVCCVPIQPSIFFTWKIRIMGIDTPELHSRIPLEVDAARVVKDYLADKLNGKTVIVNIVKNDKYGGRFDGEIFFVTDDRRGESIGEHLLKKSFAKPYDGGQKTPWTPQELRGIVNVLSSECVDT